MRSTARAKAGAPRWKSRRGQASGSRHLASVASSARGTVVSPALRAVPFVDSCARVTGGLGSGVGETGESCSELRLLRLAAATAALVPRLLRLLLLLLATAAIGVRGLVIAGVAAAAAQTAAATA